LSEILKSSSCIFTWRSMWVNEYNSLNWFWTKTFSDSTCTGTHDMCLVRSAICKSRCWREYWKNRESKRGQRNNCLRGEVLQYYLIIHCCSIHVVTSLSHSYRFFVLRYTVNSVASWNWIFCHINRGVQGYV